MYDGAVTSPLRTTPADRRALLARHFVEVLEPLIEAGTPFSDLSVEQIITAGGISRSTFYVYFADKTELLRAMAADVIGELVGVGSSWWELPAGASRDDLRAALQPPIDTYREHRTVLGAVVDGAGYDAGLRAALRALVEEVAGSLAAHIRERGAPGLDADRTARWVIWMIERGLYQLVVDADEAEAEALVEALTEIIYAAIYAHKSR
jgi:AcrR family transcriptional regulator